MSESKDLPPTDSAAPRERFGNAGCILGCLGQLSLFFVVYFAVEWIAPEVLSFAAPRSPALVLAAIVFLSWLVPLVICVRLILRDGTPPIRADENVILAWAAASALLAGAGFLLLNVRV